MSMKIHTGEKYRLRWVRLKYSNAIGDLHLTPVVTWIQPSVIKSLLLMYSSISSSFSVSQESIERVKETNGRISTRQVFYQVHHSVSVPPRVWWRIDCPSKKRSARRIEPPTQDNRTLLPARMPQVSICRARIIEEWTVPWRGLRTDAYLCFVVLLAETSLLCRLERPHVDRMPCPYCPNLIVKQVPSICISLRHIQFTGHWLLRAVEHWSSRRKRIWGFKRQLERMKFTCHALWTFALH